MLILYISALLTSIDFRYELFRVANMLTNIIFILLSLAVSFFVVLPVIRAKSVRHGKSAGNTNHRASDLQDRKETIYAAIKDIEFDHEMGKLSDEDFQDLRQQYKKEAMALLKKIDGIEKKTGGRGKNGSSAKQAAQFCWKCGKKLTQDDRFCPECGQNIQEA